MGMEERFSRKDLFRLGLRRATELVGSIVEGSGSNGAVRGTSNGASRPPVEISFVRPPGALEEAPFLEACTRCDDCIKACPHWVIRKAGPEMGATLEGTPIIIPQENPCLMCAEFPCVAACESGALILSPGSFVRVGVARVDSDTCYMAQGQPCDYCMVHCPTRPKAIRALDRGAVAQVDEALCTGCGKCAEICPANSISIEDLRMKPREEEVAHEV